MFIVPDGRVGILPAAYLRKAEEAGILRSEKYRIPDGSFQPASLDLRLGEKAYRLRCSFLPDGQRVQDKLADYAMGEIDLRDGAILERNRPYLVPLMEGLQLPQTLWAKTNPRSSTGRLDVFTRVVTDHNHRFDEIKPGYEGKLYLEVVSRSFTIRVKTGLSLNQIRLVSGDSACDDEGVRRVHNQAPILFANGQPVGIHDLTVSGGLFLSVDLAGGDRQQKVVGYKAKKNSFLLDLSLLGQYSPDDFWERLQAERKHRLVLEPEEFYLLLSMEGVRIPPEFAAEMTAYDPTSGELRSHYAGFFDPGFGHDPQGLRLGSRAVLEVRAHDVPFMLEHGQKVCKLQFQRMLEPPNILYGSAIGSSYQYQELMLSKHFYSGYPGAAPQLSFFQR
ncbi:MAG: 2'-deoxycytidine 5'-triphosphate deaminase [Chloroflexota bacterium]|nr:2'-deoxycytidine 5'-triphosphate deaminase [Chloroflexota bacterium]